MTYDEFQNTIQEIARVALTEYGDEYVSDAIHEIVDSRCIYTHDCWEIVNYAREYDRGLLGEAEETVEETVDDIGYEATGLDDMITLLAYWILCHGAQQVEESFEVKAEDLAGLGFDDEDEIRCLREGSEDRYEVNGRALTFDGQAFAVSFDFV